MSLTFQTFLLDGGEFPNNRYGQAEVKGKQKVKYHRVQGHITSETKTVIGKTQKSENMVKRSLAEGKTPQPVSSWLWFVY